MTLRQQQSCWAYGGLCCTVFSIVACIVGLWTVAAVGFAGSAACWSSSSLIANRRRERLGSAVIRKTREFEDHAATQRTHRQRMSRLTDQEMGELFGVETASRNLRTATSQAIRDA